MGYFFILYNLILKHVGNLFNIDRIHINVIFNQFSSTYLLKVRWVF